MTRDFVTQRSTRTSRIAAVVSAALILVLVAAPWWAGRANLRLFGDIYVYVALASLWNLLGGYTGLVSIGQQLYVGVGGYILFALAISLGVSPLLAIPLAGAAAAVIALPVAALLFRLQGAYFAIGAWVAAEVFRLGAAQLSFLGGGSGTNLPSTFISGIAASREQREWMVYWLGLGLGLATLVCVIALLRSRTGLALTAIRDSEIASESLGVDIGRTKLLVYVTTAGLTSMIGALIFLQKLRISPDAGFSVNDWTAYVIFIVVIGGIGTIEGPIIGTLIFFILRETLAELGAVYLLVLGLVAILVMLKAPKGMWGTFSDKTGIALFPIRRSIVGIKSVE
jgi:branched-chain amino acid transport system permease protein